MKDRPAGQRADAGTWVLRLAVGAILLFLIAPIVIIIIISFNGSRLLSFPPKSYGLEWYGRFLGDPEWRRALWTSVQVGLLTTVIATTVGFFAALALVRGAFGGKTTIYGLLLTPMIIPNIIVAIAFYMTFAKIGATGSIFAMAIGHSVLALPLVVIILTASLRAIDQRYESAALSLGGSRFYVFRRVTLPLAAPGLISAGLFAFLSSFDELLVALFLAGVRTQTLTVRVWNSLTLDLEPTIAAVSAFLVALTAAILALDALIRRGARA